MFKNVNHGELSSMSLHQLHILKMIVSYFPQATGGGGEAKFAVGTLWREFHLKHLRAASSTLRPVNN